MTTTLHRTARNRAKMARAGALEGLRTSDSGLRKSSVVRSPMSFVKSLNRPARMGNNRKGNQK